MNAFGEFGEPLQNIVNALSGENNNFIAKAFCFFTGGPDKMIGPEFEKGLAQMKAVVEKK